MPAVGTAVAAIVTAIKASAVATAIVKTVVAVGLSVLAQSLRKKPKLGGNGAFKQDQSFMVRQSAYPRRLLYGKTRVGGIWFYANTTGSTNEYLHLVLGICEGPIEAVDEMYFGDELVEFNSTTGEVSTAKYTDHVRVFIHLGDQTTADATLVAEDSNWTSNHKLLGIAYAYIRLKHSNEVFESGLPEISFVPRGANDVENPLTGGSGYNNNAAAVWNHYLQRARTGPNVSPSNIDQQFLEAAAIRCNQDVDLTGGGTEKRYTINGAILLDEDPEEIALNIVEAMAGWQVFTNGVFRLYAGEWNPPTFEITEDMVVGDVTVKNKLPVHDRVNTVKGVYRDPENDYQPSDFPTITNVDYKAEDGDIEYLSDKELPFTISAATAQRLAKIDLERARRQKILQLICNLRAFPVAAGENVRVTLPLIGYEAKEFFVDKTTLGTAEDAPALIFDLVETDRDIYNWEPDIDEREVNTPAALSVDAPAVSLTASPEPCEAELPTASFDESLGLELAIADDSSFDFLEGTGAWTITLWFYKDSSTADNYATLIGQGDGDLLGGSDGYAIQVTDSGGTSSLVGAVRDGGGTVRTVTDATTVPNDEWILVSLRYDGASTLKLWAKSIDSAYSVNTSIATLVSGVATSSVDHTLGCAQDANTDFHGRISAVGMWSIELSNGDLDTLFAGGFWMALMHNELTAPFITADLKHYWNMDERVGTREDEVGSADWLDVGSTGVGALLGRVLYNFNVVLTSSAPIYWKNDETLDDIGLLTAGATVGSPAIVTAAHQKIVARAIESGEGGQQSPLYRAYYGFDYVTAAWSGALQAHFVAGLGVRLDGSGNVEHWQDVSGQGNDAFQTTSGSRPLYVANALDGKPGIRFDGVDDFLEFPQPFSGTQKRSVLAVFKSSATTNAAQNENVLLDLQDNASPAAGGQWALGMERQMRVIGDSTKYQTHNTEFTGVRFYVVGVHWDNDGSLANDVDVYVDEDNKGVVATSDVAHSLASSTNATIGKSKALSGSEFTGDLLELIIINDHLGARERQLMQQYLLGKYGL